MTISFGYYPRRFDVELGTFSFCTLPDLDLTVIKLMADSGVYGDWIYPPLREIRSFGSATSVLPYPSRVFGLPKTHLLSHSSDDPERSRFLVWVFGFLVGMRLSDLEAGFLDAAAILPGVSNDMIWSDDSLRIALTKADEFYGKHVLSPRIALAVRAVVHSYLLSDTPTSLDFERFLHLYTAIDASYAAQILLIGKPAKPVSHAERIAYLCESLGIPIPWWAARDSPFVAKRRNEAIHEGLFFGEPWGFATFGGNEKNDSRLPLVLLELQKLTSRILMALLNIRDEAYLTSSLDDRQRHGVHLR